MSPISGDPFGLAKCLDAALNVHEDSKDIAKSTVRELQQELNHHGHGRMYGTHQASAPGEPPAPDTRHLQSSVRGMAQRTPTGGTVTLYSNDQVAVYTEFGTNTTEDHQGMLPRPWMRPTMKRLRTTIGRSWATGIVRRERARARTLKGGRR